MIFVTADIHFSHRNIIKYCKRPFSSVENMNEVLINNWNDIVKENDDIYVIGDFCFGKGQHIFDRLKGNKYLIIGNHDKDSINIKGWKEITRYKELNYQNKKFILFHYAMRVWNCSHYGSYHLYGHSHGALEGSRIKNSCDVGIDCWDFTPVSFNNLLKFFEKDK